MCELSIKKRGREHSCLKGEAQVRDTCPIQIQKVLERGLLGMCNPKQEAEARWLQVPEQAGFVVRLPQNRQRGSVRRPAAKRGTTGERTANAPLNQREPPKEWQGAGQNLGGGGRNEASAELLSSS